MLRVASLVVVGLGCSVAMLAGCAQQEQHAGHQHAAAASGTPADMQLPPGWTQEDMMAYGMAGTPGEQHAMLASHAGNWKGTSTMWMAPGAPEVVTESSCVTTTEMDGRFSFTRFKGEMPGMGPYSGFGIMGFDNVSQKFVSTWLDNHGTGIMRGVGTLSADKKTLTTEYTYNCPITKGPVTMREIDTFPDSNTMIMEMYATDPKVKVEYKCMRIVLKRVG